MLFAKHHINVSCGQYPLGVGFFFFAQHHFLEVCPNYYISNTSFLLIVEWSSMVWMDHSLFDQLNLWVISCLEFLEQNKAAMNVRVYRFLCEHVFISLE